VKWWTRATNKEQVIWFRGSRGGKPPIIEKKKQREWEGSKKKKTPCGKNTELEVNKGF